MWVGQFSSVFFFHFFPEYKTFDSGGFCGLAALPVA